MNKGKVTCEVLKEIRKQIADQNGIDYQTRECTFEGECRGTCPACESEIHYLENEIVKKKYLGKAVVLAGLSVGLMSSLTGCGHETHNKAASNVYEVDEDIRVGGDYPSKDSMHQSPKDTFKTTKNNCNLDTYEGFLQVGKDPFANDIVLDTTDPIIDEVVGDIPPIRGMIESMPEFPGGNDSLLNYLKKELIYPETCKKDSISGVVLIEFIIEKDGSILDVSALIKVHPDLDAEAIRVVKNMPKWKPSAVRLTPHRTFMQLPIRFSLE